MGLLRLLTFTLLSVLLSVNAQPRFILSDITLSIEPGSEVPRGTNVTLRCQAVVDGSGQEALSREYTIFKDKRVVYTKTSSTAEDLLYPLSDARVSNTGSYRCKINIKGQQKTSRAKRLTVTGGLSKPVLHLNRGVVAEGDEVTAKCTAPGETGPMSFNFYEDSREISEEEKVNSNQAEAKISLSSIGIHKIHCTYTIEKPFLKSEESNNVTLSVKELLPPVLEIFPRFRIYEGDQIFLSCTVRNFLLSFENVILYLYQGNQLLSFGYNTTTVNHSLVALAKDPGEFKCKFKMGDVVRWDLKNISVTELFSVPTLTMSPAEVFQRDHMTLTCKSESSASERLGKEELTYTLDPPESQLIPRGTGVFSGRVPQDDFSYTCVAQAKGIKKHSETLTVRPKVSVSTPKISLVGRAVLGQPFKILCMSDVGSLPINYTLLRGYDQLSTITVKLPHQQALFTVAVNNSEDISKYMCEAKNSQREGPLSKRLNATVIVPLTQPTLTVIPDLPDISEGDHLYLICGVKGTPPVTFKWYRAGSGEPLHIRTSTGNSSDYQIPRLSKEHSGTYYCEAVNHANNVVRSDQVTIEVCMALWKKVVIGVFPLLATSVVTVVCVLCFRSKRGRANRAVDLEQNKRSHEAGRANRAVDLEQNKRSHEAGRANRAVDLEQNKRSPEAGRANRAVDLEQNKRSHEAGRANRAVDLEQNKRSPEAGRANGAAVLVQNERSPEAGRANRAVDLEQNERSPEAANNEESSVGSDEPVEESSVGSDEPVEESSVGSDEPVEESSVGSESTVVSDEPDVEESSVGSEGTVVSHEPDVEKSSVVSHEPDVEKSSVVSHEPDVEKSSMVSHEPDVEKSSVVSHEPDVEYTEEVHPQTVDPARG